MNIEFSGFAPKKKSIKKTMSAIMIEAIKTTIELCCSSGHVGQVTLYNNSLYDSLIYKLNFSMVLENKHGRQGSNLRPLVLETSALPTELRPFFI